MKILGIETSCDETGAAIVEDGNRILSNIVSTSTKLHQKYGGIVPEVAAREQIQTIIPVIDEAFAKAKVGWNEINAISVTNGPGLIGSLLVGVETAKTLAWVYKKPLIPINHLVGHVYANWLNKKPANFPHLCLIVSGGHTDLVVVKSHANYKWLGGTRDDAAGEVFDKVARLIGLEYPGGPEIDKSAKLGNPLAYHLPRPMINSNDFDFSFSGLKTAVVNLWKKIDDKDSNDMAASFQKALVDVLVRKTLNAAKKFRIKSILVGGGVAANSLLRSDLTQQCQEKNIRVSFPDTRLAIDNGAMIAAAAFFNFKPIKIDKVQVIPNLHF